MISEIEKVIDDTEYFEPKLTEQEIEQLKQDHIQEDADQEEKDTDALEDNWSNDPQEQI